MSQQPGSADRKAYVFDTTTFSNLVRQNNPDLLARIRENQGNVLVLCEAVIYEVERGLQHKGATVQLGYFREQIIPLFSVVQITLDDWRVAALLWVEMRRQGRQLSDVDFLLAAVTLRLGGVLVSTDEDFNALPIKRENWHTPPP